jgi:hypothetical protein
MAKMFPDRLRDDVESRAERLLYKEFQEQLSDDFGSSAITMLKY